MASLDELLKKRDEFLEKHPDMVSYQQEIDRILENTLPENRITVLGIMMNCKLAELSVEFERLANIIKKGERP